LRRLLRHGLAATAPLWPPIQTAYALVHHAAHLLANHDGLDAAAVRQAYQEQVLALMHAHRADPGLLASATAHFAKVTSSYWAGLFHCYDIADLPRTVPRSGAVFRRGSSPGAARDRAQDGLAGHGRARSGADGSPHGRP
jgi:hypothetical protein